MEKTMLYAVIYLALFSSSGRATITIKLDSDTAPPVNLQDASDYSALDCGVEEGCSTKRIHKCASTTSPHISCGSVIWKEELVGCYTCTQGVWQDKSTRSKCDGTGCSDTVESFERTCANRAVNPNCKLIQTRYCKQESICNGTWSSWTSDSPECKDQCGSSRLRVMHRTCMKGGEPRSSCKIPKSSTSLEDTYIDYCTAIPCQTTTESTTVVSTTTSTTEATTIIETTAATTTTSPPTFLSSWSEWEACTATCNIKEGIQKRTRKCMNQDNKETTAVSCPGKTLTEDRKCNFANVQKCEEENINTSTTNSQEMMAGTDMPGVEWKSVKKVELGIADKASINMTATSTQEPMSMKREHKILIIVLVTTGFLILIAIIAYVFCIKKKKERGKKHKIGSITVVGLQSHTGFMDGMEAYGFTKSMVPTGDIFSAMNPAAENRNLTATAEVNTVQESEPV